MDSIHTGMKTGGAVPDVIDLSSESAVAAWAEKLDVTTTQIKTAVDAVGNQAADVEMHLKGTRATTNVDRVDEAGG